MTFCRKAHGDLLRGLGGNDALLSMDWVDSAGPHGFKDVTLQGGAGADYLFTRGGPNAHENGDSGNDILIADSSASTAANYLYGGAGADDLQAKAEAFNSYEDEFEDQKATNSVSRVTTAMMS